jgi:tRNA1(Val) A37 N6-methylase TrmN6
MNTVKEDYSVISKQLTNTISKDDKKDNGIYFTPPSCINENIKLLLPYLENVINVLEPSCGSGEYITALHSSFPRFNIVGIEKNKQIYDSILQLSNEKITIMNEDFLKYTTESKYDLIIGNPPFYVMKKGDVEKIYHKFFDGRPNIFILFIIKSLQLLNENGILSFILPKNFLNCLYYDKTRKYINKYYNILNIVECDQHKYIDTKQNTIILILQKKKGCNNNFILKMSNYTIFGEKVHNDKIMKLYKNSKSLSELNFKVSIGTVVWNQCKDILTNDETKTRLIYTNDIEDNTLIQKEYKNVDKKQFINKPGINNLMILINRGFGVGKYIFNYCLLNEKKEFLIENHLICIEYKYELPYEELLVLYNKIIKSFSDKRTLEFINLYFGNNAINSTELSNIFPIYQDI